MARAVATATGISLATAKKCLDWQGSFVDLFYKNKTQNIQSRRRKEKKVSLQATLIMGEPVKPQFVPPSPLEM